MQFSTVLVALLASSALAIPAPHPAAAGVAPKPAPKPTKPNDPTDPTSQEPTAPESETPTEPDSQTPTVHDSDTPTEPGTETPANPESQPAEPETSDTASNKPTGSGETFAADTIVSCSAKRDSLFFGWFSKRGCEPFAIPPGAQPPKDPATLPPYQAPSAQEVADYVEATRQYVSGSKLNPANAKIAALNQRYIVRTSGRYDTMLYAAAGKEGAMVQTKYGDRLNVGQSYGNYDERFFDPKMEPAKSILATGDDRIIQNFFGSTSADFVNSAKPGMDANGDPTGIVVISTDLSDHELATNTGAKGFPLIFTSDENPAALAHPEIRMMVRVDPAVAEIAVGDTGPALAVVVSGLDNDLGKVGDQLYRKISNNWVPVRVMWDKLNEHGPKSWP